MSVALYTHPEMLGHVPPEQCPELPARLLAVTDALSDAGDLELEVYDAPLIEPADLALVHSQAFVASLIDFAPGQGAQAARSPGRGGHLDVVRVAPGR